MQCNLSALPVLSATRDQYYATANIYDASGNRAWKLGGEVNWMWNNGQGWQAYGDLNLRTWYQSDLALRLRSATSRCQGDVVYFTDQAMTKHYFIAGAALSLSKRQRIASKLAESLAPEVAQNLKDKPLTPLSGDIRDLAEATPNRIARDFECVGLDYNAFYPGETRLEALENLLNVPEQPDEYQLFFYHSDHLGSSSFITDINGDATQHLQYLPFGEDFVHQQNTAAYYTPYTFSGKERDLETSLSYFGARYYEAGLSVWLSVDPMAEKGPHLSPYNFCFNQPITYRDPDGNWPTPETAWDIINVVMGAASFGANVATGNVYGAVVDGIGLVYDGMATAVPVLPGGASTAIGAYRFVRMADNLVGSINQLSKLSVVKNSEKLTSLSNKAQNALKQHLKLDDVAGAVQDILGIPIKKNGKIYDHLKEVNEGLGSLQNYKAGLQNTLKNSSNLSEKEIKTINKAIVETDAHISRINKILDKAKEVSSNLE